jgi:hypothetical protein
MTVALLYSGDLVWSDRERGVHELVAAAPVGDAAVLLPKALALLAVVASLLAASVAAALGVEWARGHAAIDPGAYLRVYLLPHAGVAAVRHAGRLLAGGVAGQARRLGAGPCFTDRGAGAGAAGLERRDLPLRPQHGTGAGLPVDAPGPLGLAVAGWLRIRGSRSRRCCSRWLRRVGTAPTRRWPAVAALPARLHAAPGWRRPWAPRCRRGPPLAARGAWLARRRRVRPFLVDSNAARTGDDDPRRPVRTGEHSFMAEQRSDPPVVRRSTSGRCPKTSSSSCCAA